MTSSHRLKRLWRFLDNPRLDPLAVQTAMIPHTLAALAPVRWLGLAIDWTMWDILLPTGQRVRYQVLRIAVPLYGRALPLLQLAYDRDHLPADASQNQLEERALAAVLAALPLGVRPVILADRGFARAPLFQWLQERRVDYVIRVNKGTCLTDARNVRTKLGDAGMRPGEIRWLPHMRYGLYHGRPRDLWLQCCLLLAGRQAPRRSAPEGAEGAVVSGDESGGCGACGGVVLAPGVDRAEFQGQQERLRHGRGTDPLSVAIDAAAGGADAGAQLADAARRCHGWGVARRLARPRQSTRECQLSSVRRWRISTSMGSCRMPVCQGYYGRAVSRYESKLRATTRCPSRIRTEGR